MKDMLVLRVVASFIIPFITLFGFYVQLHGEYSPGGGFQAGVIIAAAFVLYCLIWGLKAVLDVISLGALRVFSALGVLIYAGVGIFSLLSGWPFLGYSAIDPAHPAEAQTWGIFLVELGVGLTVFSVMLLIFLVFTARRD